MARSENDKQEWEQRTPGEGQASEDPSAQPRDRVTALEAELAEAREQARQAQDRWVRERADLENVKKRAARERADTVRYGNEDLIKDLLPVVDDLERAVAASQGGGNGAPLAEGVSLVLKKLLEVLDRHGVSRVDAAGTRFDPAHHEAMAQIESTEHAEGAVVDEHRSGYRLHDRLIRPALVTVSKGPPGGGNLAKD